MIDLTHVGEILVAELLKIKPKAVKTILGKELTGYKISPEIKLTYADGKELIFDGMSRIDVGIIHGGTCYPIELKLGTTSMGNCKSGIGRFTQGFNLSHDGSRISGSMISILSNIPDPDDKGSFDKSNFDIQYLRAKGCKLADNWILIVRTKKIADELKKGNGVFAGEKCNCDIFSFAELFGEDEVNEIMKKQLREKNFYNRWLSA